MTSKILFFIMMSAYFFLPFLLYRSNIGFMARFCLRMTALAAARKLYRQLLLALLCVFHFLYLSVQHESVGVLVSTMAFSTFYVFMDVEKWLHRLNESGKVICFAALSTVVFAFIPHLFTLASTISFVILAALFYPSRIVISLWESTDGRKALAEDKDTLVISYFSESPVSCRSFRTSADGEKHSIHQTDYPNEETEA